MIDGHKLIMSLNDWWYSSFGYEETEESKAIKKVIDEVEKYVEQAEQTEPQTNADQHIQRIEYVENAQRCRKCKHIESEYLTPIASDGCCYTYVICTASECKFEPKDEPSNSEIPNNCEPQPCEWCKFYDGESCFSQEPCKVMLYFKTEPQTVSLTSAHISGDIYHKVKDEPQTDEDCDYCKMTHKYWYEHCDICKRKPKDEPQIDCAWK